MWWLPLALLDSFATFQHVDRIAINSLMRSLCFFKIAIGSASVVSFITKSLPRCWNHIISQKVLQKHHDIKRQKHN